MLNDKNTNDNTESKKDETSNTEPKNDEAVKSESKLVASEPATTETAKTETTPDEPNASKNKTAFFNKRSFKFGSMATAFTAIFIVIVILVNVGLTLLSSKFPLSLDLTSTKSYDISSATIKYIAKVKQPITIKVFATEPQMEGNTNFLAPMKIMQQYQKYNSNINIEYIDPDKDPTAVAAYKNETLSKGDVVVSTIGPDKKEHYKYISSSDLLVTETDQSTGSENVVGNKTEQVIDSAIDYVTSTVHPTLLFTSGHNEATEDGYESLLKNSGYAISSVNTVTGKINEKASAIVIIRPKTDFSSYEISKIDKFLKNGGKFGKNIFIYLDPTVGTLPNLQEYMSEWGVKVGKGVIIDNSQCYDSSPYCPISYTLDSDVVGSNISTNIGTEVAVSLPLTPMFSSKDTRTVVSVIKTESTSTLLPMSKKAKATSYKNGPFTTMTLSTWSSSSNLNTNVTKSNMVVSGSYEMLDSTILSSTNKNNANVLLGVANKVMSKKSAMNVESKYDESTSLSLSNTQRRAIMIIFVIVIPLAILILGIVMWLRRRHL